MENIGRVIAGIVLLISAAATLISLAALLLGDPVAATPYVLAVSAVLTITLLIYFNREERR